MFGLGMILSVDGLEEAAAVTLVEKVGRGQNGTKELEHWVGKGC